MRVVNGTAVYTSNFVPSATPLTAITNTVLLTCQTNVPVDASASALTVTSTGTSTSTSNPFDANLSPWSSNSPGWSTAFNGITTYASVPFSTNFNFAADFTIECWFNVANAGRSGDSSKYGCIIGSYTNAVTTPGWAFSYEIVGSYVTTFIFGINATNALIITNLSIPLNTWTHVALASHSSILALYVNGVLVQTAASATATGSSTVWIGQNPYQSTNQSWIVGYISNLRVVNGTAVYTPNFTTPAASFVPDTYTSLLLHLDNNVTDSSSNAFTVTNTSVTFSNSIYEFGGYSGSFNGSSAYLSVNNNIAFDLSACNFTVEGWFYATGMSHTYNVIVSKDGVSGSTNWQWCVYLTSTGLLTGYIGSGNGTSSSQTIASTSATSTNTWNHFALVLNGTLLCLYQNGVLVASAQKTATMVNGTGNLLVGAQNSVVSTTAFAGYIDEIRVSRGVARYKSNFVVPIAPLTAIANTVLLTCQSSTLVNNEPNALVVTPTSVLTSNQNPFGGTTSTNFDNSLYFNGSSYIGVLASVLNSLSSSFTIECWVYPTVAPTGMTVATCENIIAITNGTTSIWHAYGIGSTGYVIVSQDKFWVRKCHR